MLEHFHPLNIFYLVLLLGFVCHFQQFISLFPYSKWNLASLFKVIKIAGARFSFGIEVNASQILISFST